MIAENQQKFQKEYDNFHQPPIRTLSLRYTLWANIIAHSIIQKLKNTLSVLRLNTTIQMHSIFLEKCICLKNEMAEKCFRQCALNGNNSGQLAYGLMLLRDGQKKAAYQWLRKSARSGNDIAKKIISGKKADIPFEFRLAGCMQAQRTLLHKSSSMLRNALKSEEAKTARLMREFEIEQEMAKAKEQYHSI